MIYRTPFPDDHSLTHGVMSRRVAGWFIDAVLIGVIWVSLCLALVLFGFLTLGLGFGALGVLPFVPFCYQVLSLISPLSATPGQHWLGLVVLRNDDFARPSAVQAMISVLAFYLTLATSGLLLLIALITIRHRTLHDLVSGLVVVRIEAMQPLTPSYGYGNMPGGSPYA